MASNGNGWNWLTRIVQLTILATFMTGIAIWVARVTPSTLACQLAQECEIIKPKVEHNTICIEGMKSDIRHIMHTLDKIEQKLP